MSKPPFITAVIMHGGFCVVLGTIFGVASSTMAAFSALLGGVTIVLANAWYLWRLSGISLGGDSSEFLRKYYRAEFSKLCVAVAILMAVLYLDQHHRLSTPFAEGHIDTKAMFVSFLLMSLVITLSNTVLFARWINHELTD